MSKKYKKVRTVRKVPVVMKNDRSRPRPPKTFSYYGRRYERRWAQTKLTSVGVAQVAANNAMSWHHFMKMIVVVFKIKGDDRIYIYQRDTRFDRKRRRKS
jgi:hypothetical protein